MNIDEIKSILPKRKTDAHKGDFGKALLIAGKSNMPGAAIIATEAALKCGVGLAVCATERSVIYSAAARLPEAVYFDTETGEREMAAMISSADAILIGPGMGVCERTYHLIDMVIRYGHAPLVIDADGINCVANGIELGRYNGFAVMTPHAGEMARLIGCLPQDVNRDRIGALKQCTQRYNMAVVLKGSGTLIDTGNGDIIVNNTGNPGMAKPGSGDMLSGMMVSLLAQNIDYNKAIPASVYLHGLAGDYAKNKFSERAMQVTDMINALPEIFKTVEL